MSDESPEHDDTVETPAAGAAASPEAAGSRPSRMRSGVMVPAWLLTVLALVAVAGIGFGIGRWTDDDHGDDGRGAGLEQLIERFGPGLRERLGDQGPLNQIPQNPGPQNQQPSAQGAYLGVSVQDATGDVKGARITTVVAGSAADKAGLKEGDVVTAVDGNSVTSAAQLTQRIVAHDSGDQVTITYTRNASSSKVQAKLGSRAASNNQVN